MPTWDVELRGTITLDIKYLECDAETEAEVRQACAAEMPNLRGWRTTNVQTQN